MIVDSYLATADLAVGLLRTPGLAHHWDAPSALPEFRISGLAGHLGMSVFLVANALDAEVPDEPPVDAVRYFADMYQPGPALHDEMQVRVRSIGEEVAADGPEALADRVAQTLDVLRERLPALPPDQLVFGRRAVLRLDQWLLTRLIELAVHLDDLAVSLDVPTPDLPPEAADHVLTALVRLATAHHGAVQVLRALSRRERALVTVTAF